MLNRLILVMLAACMVQSCSSGDNSTEIDYATVDPLQTAIVLEIGESEDYLPGNLYRLMVTSDGTILVADRGSITIEQFDASGNHVATIAKEGKGPGEIPNRYFPMDDMGYDTLMVGSLSDRQNYFAKGDNGIFQFVRAAMPEERPERSVNILGPASDSTFYAIAIGIGNVQDAMKNEKDYREAPIVLVDKSGRVLQDSLHLLKKPTSHTYKAGDRITFYGVPYRAEDQFVLLDNGGFMIGRPDSSKLYFYNNKQELKRSVALNVKPRPVTSADLDYELGNTDRGPRNEIEARVPDTKPLYRDIWATDNYLWLHTNTDETGKEIVVLDYDGNALGKFMLPEVDKIEAFRENRIYTIHESPDKGDLIRVYQVNL